MTPAVSCTPHGSTLGWVDAHDFAAHTRHLTRSTGTPWRVLALLSGVSSRTVRRLMGHGRPIRRIRSVDARRLLCVTPLTVSEAEHQLVDATSTRNRVHILLENGHSGIEIAGYLAISLNGLTHLMTDTDPLCTAMTRLRARAACEAHHLLWADQAAECGGSRPAPRPECAV